MQTAFLARLIPFWHSFSVCDRALPGAGVVTLLVTSAVLSVSTVSKCISNPASERSDWSWANLAVCTLVSLGALCCKYYTTMSQRQLTCVFTASLQSTTTRNPPGCLPNNCCCLQGAMRFLLTSFMSSIYGHILWLPVSSASSRHFLWLTGD